MTRGLMVSVLLCSLAASVGAEDRNAPDDHGWIFGGGLTGGNLAFTGADRLAVAVGPVERVEVFLFGSQPIGERRLQLMDASGTPPEGTVRVARFPGSTAAGALSLHGGYAFSPRLALLADAEVMASAHDGFGNGVFAAVLRYRPVHRVWIEAGPARGDLSYGYEDTGSVSNSIAGSGFLAAGGVTVMAKPRWTLDVQARYGKIWYDGFQARNVSVGLSIGRVRLGKRPMPAAPAAARPASASRG